MILKILIIIFKDIFNIEAWKPKTLSNKQCVTTLWGAARSFKNIYPKENFFS